MFPCPPPPRFTVAPGSDALLTPRRTPVWMALGMAKPVRSVCVTTLTARRLRVRAERPGSNVTGRLRRSTTGAI